VLAHGWLAGADDRRGGVFVDAVGSRISTSVSPASSRAALRVRSALLRHFNPVVSFVNAHFGGMSRRDALADLHQATGCSLGATAANAWLALSAITVSIPNRASPAGYKCGLVGARGWAG
jgi:hypothetical protein